MKHKLWLSAALLASMPILAQAQWGITYVDTSHAAGYVTAGNDGNLYIVSPSLGNYGEVLKLTLTWAGATVTSTSSVLFNFSPPGTAISPSSPLVEDANGNFFGVVWQGGTGSGYYGAVYEYSASGTYSQLYDFANDTTGCPAGNVVLVQGAADTVILYGESTGCILGSNYGEVFKLKGKPGVPTSWQLTILHKFTGGTSDGGAPANILLASDGNLYGITRSGATFDNGGIFKISPSGGTLTSVYSFPLSAGSYFGGLVEQTGASSLTLVGQRNNGISGTNYGYVYKVVESGGSYSVSTIHSFGTGTSNGEYPQGSLIYSSTLGYFFGMTYGGGASGGGTFYSITPSGTFSVVNSFSTYHPDNWLTWMKGTGCNPCDAGVSSGSLDVWVGVAP